VLIGSLQPGGLVRLALAGGKVVREERYREGELGERIRDVQQGPDGLVYVVTDEGDGRVLKVLPAAPR
jgi:glucose/arabinose dehydrogenase